MHLVDHFFIVMLFVIQPIHGAREGRQHLARAAAGEPFDRVRFYRQIAAFEWVSLGVLAGAWFTQGRPIADLGFVAPEGLGFWVGVGLIFPFIGILVFSVRSARKASEAEKEKQAKSFGKAGLFMPHDRRDLRAFNEVAVTAGVVEEIVYRGFTFWYLGLFMPLWAVVVATSVGFGFVHGYQGMNGAVRAGLVGLAFGAFYVLTGSIWLPIIAHAALDLLQGKAIVEILARRKASAAQPAERSRGDPAVALPASTLICDSRPPRVP